MLRWCFTVLFLSTLLLIVEPLQAENWPRFRGPNGQGISLETGFPTTWTEDDYAWTLEIPGMSHSSPVVWEENLYLTTGLNDGEVRRLICLDAATGKQKWERDLALNTVHLHNKNSFASGSPSTNGTHVVAAYADEAQFIVACWTKDGKELWRTDIGGFLSEHGPSCSPIIHNNLVIVPKDMKGPSLVAAFDLQTGKEVWRTDREFRRTSYATPIVRTRADGIDEVICVSGMMGISGLNVQSGEMLWRTESFPERTVGSPVLCDDHVVAISGGGGKGRNLFVAPLDREGTVEPSLKITRSIPYVPTPVCKDGLYYMILDGGIASCLEMPSGKEVWTERIDGNFSGSPIWLEGRLYMIDEAGTVVVLSAGREFKELGRVALGDLSYSTPVVANGRMYLKTSTKLFCLPRK